MTSKATYQKDGLVSSVDSVFVVAGEMVPQNGEDSYAYAVNDSCGIMGVFDGCGGIGSRKYPVYNNKTGAYVSSHAISKAALNWFDEYTARNVKLNKTVAEAAAIELKYEIHSELKDLESRTSATAIKGSLTKSFPSTASVILFNAVRGGLDAAYLWAGDSRGFLLSSSGLTQVTVDDIDESEDALSNLSSDGKLTNVVSAVGDFTLHSKLITCTQPSVLITATDGCFGYFSTPMEFEYMLLYTLAQSSSINQWKDNISKYLLKYTGDDYTMGVVAFGYKSFKVLKKMFEERTKFLYKNYISVLGGLTDEQKVKLWEVYKKQYYRGV